MNLRSVPLITKHELEKLIKSDEKYLLIDVRESYEVQQTGLIPTARHIPLGRLIQGLTNTHEWENNCEIPLPDKDENIIFYCKVGGRSHKAAELTRSLGYKNSKNYAGSAVEWFHLN